MARSTKSYEERMLQLEKKEQESLEKAKQYAAQKRELKKRQKDVETKKRTHRLCQIGGAFSQTCSCRRRHSSLEGRIPCRLLCTGHSYAEGVPADTIFF